jgi:segregation and condensation protein A
MNDSLVDSKRILDEPPAVEVAAFAETSTEVPEQPRVRDPERFTGHRVQLRLFEGPLDLLLYLVRAHRYDICDIPISDVTTQFIEFLTLMDELDLEYAGDFLVTAASLMAIKSRMLLPKHQSQNEDEIEDDSDDDPRKQLVDRLLEYQRFQDAAEQLKELRDERASLYARPPLAPDVSALIEEISNPTDDDDERARRETGALLGEISTFDLLRALQKVLDRQAEAPVATIRREPFSLPERVRDVVRRLTSTRSGLSFSELCDDCESRLEVVITFLAVLELIRRAQASIEQLSLFDEIWVKKR